LSPSKRPRVIDPRQMDLFVGPDPSIGPGRSNEIQSVTVGPRKKGKVSPERPVYDLMAALKAAIDSQSKEEEGRHN
jgi:hypothetical protein